jgi:hypothetical protein
MMQPPRQSSGVLSSPNSHANRSLVPIEPLKVGPGNEMTLIRTVNPVLPRSMQAPYTSNATCSVRRNVITRHRAER